MHRIARPTWLRALVIVLYAVAVMALGFAHRPFAAPGTDGWIGLAAHDSTLLCLSREGGGKPSSFSAHCDACLLTSAPGLALAGVSALPVEFHASRPVIPKADVDCPTGFDFAGNRARAPPVRA
jgi:hypothetical protein